MRPVKEVGLQEVRSLRRRVLRANAMDRVSDPDAQFIDEHLDAVEARIIEMHETDEYGREVG